MFKIEKNSTSYRVIFVLLGVILSDKLKKKYSIIRMVQDITCVVIGFLLGGTFGIATILMAFLLGYIITHYRKLIHTKFF